jgi:Ca2+-binding EF-hand superfamily protein
VRAWRHRRDIKPENILMESKAEDAQPVIADFGFARLPPFPDLHKDSRIGTYSYMAPEIYRARQYGPHNDVWSMGVVLYILLCGYPPFYVDDERDIDGLSAQITAGRYAFHEDAWGGISASAKDLVARMLMVDHTKRITFADCLRHNWVVSHARVLVAHLPAVAPNLTRLQARRRLRAAAQAVAFGMLHMPVLRDLKTHMAGRTVSDAQLLALRTAYKAHTAADRAAAVHGVSRTQFAKILADVGLGELPCDRLFEVFDADGNGAVDLREVAVGFAALRTVSTEADLRMVFDVYDMDGSGHITLEEFARILMTTQAFGDADPDAAGGWGGRLGGGASATGSAGKSEDELADDIAAAILARFADVDLDADGKRECTQPGWSQAGEGGGGGCLLAAPFPHPTPPAVSFAEFKKAAGSAKHSFVVRAVSHHFEVAATGGAGATAGAGSVGR